VKHFYESLPGWASFGDLYTAMAAKAKHGMVFVEVGSWLGRSASLMAVELINTGMNVEFCCVDPWIDGGPDLRDTTYFTDLKKPVYETFIDNIRPVRHQITPMRMTSVEAATKFADQSVDFLMLDGDHSYEAVKADLDAWLPKMKPRGVIAGDDYLWPGVNRAFDERFGDKLRPVIKSTHRDYKMSVAYCWTQLP
jgi:predicted O-methyltransferase YrrM